MNIFGIGAASILGLLAVYLWLGQDERVTSKQDESAAEMRCERADFSLDMAAKWNEPAEHLAKLRQKAEAECKTFEVKRSESSITNAASAEENKQMKDSIGTLMK